MAFHDGGYRKGCRGIDVEPGESCLSTVLDTFNAADWIVVTFVFVIFGLMAFVMFFPSADEPNPGPKDQMAKSEASTSPEQTPTRQRRLNPRSYIPDAD